MKIRQLTVLFFILLIAFIFRLTGIDWDQGTHLHPDERFLTMVGIDLKIPASFAEYLDPRTSVLNPTNILDGTGSKRYAFFVYGTFPIALNKIFAVLTDNNTYNGFTITGRMLSAISDLLIILLLYKTVELFEKQFHLDKTLKLWAAFFYAVAVLPIQLSHFFAVDTFLNTFLFAAFYFSLHYYFKRNIHALLLGALFLGLALASKITAVFIVPLLLIFIFAARIRSTFTFKDTITSLSKNKREISIGMGSILIFLLVMYLSLRIANPYMFEYPSFLNPKISNLLLENWQTLKSWSAKDVWYPPGVQWINKPPVTFALINLAVFGLGIPYFLLSVAGVGVILFRKRYITLLITVLWVFLLFLYQSTQYANSMRYFIIIYPYLALYAAIGFLYIKKRVPLILQIVSLSFVLLWPLAFMSIYLHPHSRIRASIWIYENIPSQKTIAWELWDDPLPIRLPDYEGKIYNFRELPVFDFDTPEKWEKLDHELKQADYYILSSNRAWGSIPTAPDKYPLMSKFYQDLFAGKREFVKIKEFTSYPSLGYLGIPLTFPDDFSEEAFTVYDHPKVIIFKKINENN